MINIKNTQRSIKLDKSKIEKFIAQALDILGYTDFDIGIWFTSDKNIRFYNKTYRDKDKPTDVLSFPFYPNLKAGQKIKAASDDEKNLGDLIISPSYVQNDSEKFEVSFEDRLKLILVHGILHLLGYDHIEDKDYKVMRAKELYLLKKLVNTHLIC